MCKTGAAAGRAEFQFLPDNALKALAPDVVVWQRQGEPHQLETIKRYRDALPKAFFVYEVDDALSSVPDKSWHKPYMPPNVDEGVKAGANLCDAISVSTLDLAAHMRRVCGDMDIRVAPNMVAASDFEMARNTRLATKHQQKNKREKFRIGWGGGAGHAGDFDQMQEVFKHFGKSVEWIFLGFKPEIEATDVNVLFAGAVQPQQYIAALANLDCDLIVAPLEENHFNRCKSNIRLLEAGTCLYPVIASPVTPYVENNPPVFEYCDTPSKWIDAINRFMALSESQRSDYATRLCSWTKSNFCLDDKIRDRVEKWLPKGTKAFMPRRSDAEGSGSYVIVCEDEVPNIDDVTTTTNTLRDACHLYRNDIIYIRKGAKPPKDFIARINRLPLRQVSTVSFLSNDDGPLGFPKSAQFTQMDPSMAKVLDTVASEMYEEYPEIINSGFSCGPCVLIRRSALDMVGFPDFTNEYDDIAIVEWSAMAAGRGFINLACFGAFVHSTEQLTIPSAYIEMMAMRLGMRWPKPKTEMDKIQQARENLELRFHRQHYQSLPSANPRDYSTWALMFDTPGKRDETAMIEWSQKQHSGLIFSAVKTQKGLREELLKSRESDWVIFSEPTTDLEPHFTPLLLEAIERHPEAVIFYADHDRIGDKGQRVDHDFKPDFDHHLFLGRDYVTPIMAVKSYVIDQLLSNVIDSSAADEDCLLYDLVLRVIEELGRDKIGHIARICGHANGMDMNRLREHSLEKAKLANEHVQRMGWSHASVIPHPALMDAAALCYSDDSKDDPSVSIIIPTKNKIEMLIPCITTVLTMTEYSNYKIIIINNGSDRQEMIDYLASLTDSRIKVIDWSEPYNWSILNNFAVKQTDGEYVCFLNDDTRVLSPGWLREMVGAARLPDVAAVGARLLYPHQAVQHIGVVCHYGNNGHIHKGMPAFNPGYHGIAFLSHESTAVTGACMVIKRSIFNELGGFDEGYSHNYNDVAFCLELRKRGYLNVVATRAELQHFEGVTRPAAMSPKGQQMLRDEGIKLGRAWQVPDRYWNPNMPVFALAEGTMIAGLNYDIFAWPPIPWPWRNANTKKQRVALVGLFKDVLPEFRDGDSIYNLTINGYQIMITHPPLENCRPIDIRDVDRARHMFDTVGIDKIIISSLGEASPTALVFLTKLGIPIEYRPTNAEMICPQADMKPAGKFCNRGWSIKGECQVCIDTKNSPHGPIGIMSWLGEWMRFSSADNVTINLDNLEYPEYLMAINHLFGQKEECKE
ncbi:MAG: glycosyltransferase [Patescibacteria group bacterium]|nr:glycosyltransferase [Patescibacteria group bacterium]